MKDEDIGPRLAEAIKQSGKKVQTLAKETGIGRTTIYEMMGGKSLNGANLRKLADKSGASLYWIITGDATEPQDRPEILHACIVAFETAVRRHKLSPAPERRADAIRALYLEALRGGRVNTALVDSLVGVVSLNNPGN